MKLRIIISTIILFETILGGPALSFAQGRNDDLRLKTVVIDAGHGGKDPGTVSADRKTYEKNITLKVSMLLAEKIRKEFPDVKVILTREKDVLVPLVERARIANNANADLFISIHVNASSSSKSINGTSAWILGQSKNKNNDSYAFNMDVMKRENSVIYLEDDYSTTYQDFDSGSPESQILLRLMSNAYREQSLLFAETVESTMKKNGPFKKSIGVYQDNFCVLRQASMPAVLLELGFMTNSEDLANLRSSEKIEKTASNLLTAFAQYKKNYDHSVSLADEEPEERISPSLQSDSVLYGTQVLASSRTMSPNDKIFKGYEVLSVKAGNLYKYIIGISADRNEAMRLATEIKRSFPESFTVKIENGQATRCNL